MMISKLFIDNDDSRYCGVCGSTENVKRIVTVTDINTGQETEKSVPICMNCLKKLSEVLNELFKE